MRTLSQISEDLFCLESRAARGSLPRHKVFDEVRRIRQDLEPYITSQVHDTHGDGSERKEGTQP